MLSDTTKLNRAFKAILGTAHTEDTRLFFQELFPYLLDIVGQDIKTDQIPLWPGDHDDGWTDPTGVIMSDYRRMTAVPTTEDRVWVVNDVPGDWNTPRRYHYVHPRYDTPFNGGTANLVTSGYVVKIYEDNGSGQPGSQIPPTATPDGSSNGGWEFEYDSGILYWTATPTAFRRPFHIRAYRYVGAFGSFSSGGVQKVFSTPYYYTGAISIGDAVCVDTTLADTVRKADASSLSTANVIGFVYQKDSPNPGQCIVQVAGEVNGLSFTGNPPYHGKRMYLGANGVIQDTAPTSGVMKAVGVARNNSTLVICLEAPVVL